MRWPIIYLATTFLALPTLANAETQTLEQAWTLAYQNNPSLEAERAKLRATDEEVSQALSHWRPSIDATANVGRTYQETPSLEPFGTGDFAGTTRGYGAQLTQPLFRGGRTYYETKAAEKDVLAGRAKLSDAEQQLFLDTATAFLDVLRDEAVVQSERDNESVLQEKLHETQERFKVGDLAQTDVHQAESRLARAHVTRVQAEKSLAEDRANYLRLVGKPAEHLQPPNLVIAPSRNLQGVFDLADTHNPKVISAKFDFEQADAQIGLNSGSLLPEVNLVGNTGRNWEQNSTLPGEQTSTQVLVQLTMPLYRSGADYSRTRQAQQTASEKRLDWDEARHKAHEAADNAWQAFQAAQAALDADRTEVEAAGQALEGVKVQSKVGTRTTLDELNAEQELLDAKIDQAKSQHDRDLAVLQIRSAVGELVADNLKLPVRAYDPVHHYDDVRNQWAGFSKDDAHYAVHTLKQPTLQ